MELELNVDSRFVFYPEIRIIGIEGERYLAVSVASGNWIILDSKKQVVFLQELISGKSVGEIMETLNEDEEVEFSRLLSAIVARKYAGIGTLPQIDYLEGYKKLNIYLTNACNLRCRHCFMNAGDELSYELSTEEWKRVLMQFSRWGGHSVTFSGGEPLMRGDFVDILQYAHDLGLETTVLSNGLLWSDSLIVKSIPFIDEIQFSLDGVDEQSNAKVRGAGHFEQVVQTIIRFANSGVRTSVATTLTFENLSDDMAKLYENLKAKIDARTQGKVSYKFSKKLLNGRGHVYDRTQNDVYARAIKRIESAINPNADFENFMDGHLPNLVARNCGLGGVSIGADGRVYFCNRIFDMESAGSVKEKPLSYFMELGRKIHVDTSVDHAEPCRNCELRYICDGGCRIDDFDFKGRAVSHQGVIRNVICSSQTKRALIKRMVDSYDYFYNFD